MAEANPLISVIVPVYNVAEYLTECINSIISQTYTNLEIILVDDGSTDDCPRICDEYASKDSRIRVIHKKNGGLSDARNAGLDICTGEWIGFVDSDDFIAPNMYQQLYKAAISQNADIAVCQSVRYENGKFVNLNKDKKKEVLYSKSEMINRMFCGSGRGLIISACIKLYRKCIFDTIRFPKGVTVEDAFIILNVIEKCSCMALIPDVLYFYRIRNGSISHVRTWNKNIFDTIFVYKHNMAILEKKFPKNIDEGLCRLIWAYRISIKHAVKTLDAKEHIKEIQNYKNEFSKIFFSSLDNKFLSVRAKLDGMMVAILPIRLLMVYVEIVKKLKQVGANL